MTLIFECRNCGKRFYIHEPAESAIAQLLGLDGKLCDLGYATNTHIPTAGEVIRERAKCCNNPNVYIAKWEC